MDDYLELWEATDKAVFKFFKGSFNVRVNVNTHRKAFMKVNEMGMYLNHLAEKALESYLDSSSMA